MSRVVRGIRYETAIVGVDAVVERDETGICETVGSQEQTAPFAVLPSVLKAGLKSPHSRPCRIGHHATGGLAIGENCHLLVEALYMIGGGINPQPLYRTDMCTYFKVPCCCCPGSRKRAHKSTMVGINHLP